MALKRSVVKLPILSVGLRFQSYFCDGFLQEITARLQEIIALSRGFGFSKRFIRDSEDGEITLELFPPQKIPF